MNKKFKSRGAKYSNATISKERKALAKNNVKAFKEGATFFMDYKEYYDPIEGKSAIRRQGLHPVNIKKRVKERQLEEYTESSIIADNNYLNGLINWLINKENYTLSEALYNLQFSVKGYPIRWLLQKYEIPAKGLEKRAWSNEMIVFLAPNGSKKKEFLKWLND